MPGNRLLLKVFHNVPILVAVQALLLFSCTSHDNSVHLVIEEQLKLYPASTLQDLYKSFFQDEYGPGHMAPDSAGAAEYLDYEISEMTGRHDHTVVPCGTGKNFFRVPLDLVKDGIIPKDAYLSAFLESAESFKAPELEEWKKKWAGILQEIESMNLQLPNFESDKKAINEMLDRGETVVHHSDAFTLQYDPHYRIMLVRHWEGLKSQYMK